MKKLCCSLLILTSLFILIILNGCKDTSMKSEWKKSEITVDGDSDDWPDYSLKFLEWDDIQAILGIINNETSLNLMIRFRDKRLARMIEARGLVLWFKEKNEKNLGINYVNKDFHYRRRSMESHRLNKEEIVGPPEEKLLPEGSFHVMKDDTNEIPESGFKGILAAADFINGLYCYEFQVPLFTQSSSPYTLHTPLGNKLKIGFEIQPVSEEEKEQIKEIMKEREQEASGMRGGGMHRGRMPGGRMGRDKTGHSMPDLDGKEVWFTVLLIKNPVYEK
jgi:hypothetical protein